MTKQKLIKVLRFLLLWLALWVFFTAINISLEPSEVLIQAINGLIYTIGFYFSYYVLIRRFLYRGRYGLFTLYYLLTIAALSFSSKTAMYEVYVFYDQKFIVDNYWKMPLFLISNYVLMFTIISSLLSFRFVKDKMQTQWQLEHLQKEKITAELDFLKAQINPHFLFNSLNNILFQIDRSNVPARDTLLKFSEMLRYQLYECGGDFVSIEKEIQYLKNYVEIQMLRKSKKYHCHFSAPEQVKNFNIAPLLLIPFVENAFKHLSHHTAKKNCIAISMDYAEDDFIFSVVNDKDGSAVFDEERHKGIGLLNVKRRLQLLYPDRHELRIDQQANQFAVNLKIKLKA